MIFLWLAVFLVYFGWIDGWMDELMDQHSILQNDLRLDIDFHCYSLVFIDFHGFPYIVVAFLQLYYTPMDQQTDSHPRMDRHSLL